MLVQDSQNKTAEEFMALICFTSDIFAVPASSNVAFNKSLSILCSLNITAVYGQLLSELNLNEVGIYAIVLINYLFHHDRYALLLAGPGDRPLRI